jgi:F-type H+-transporting ATPase subunit b
MRWICVIIIAWAAWGSGLSRLAMAEEAHGGGSSAQAHGAHVGEDVSEATKDPSEFRSDLAIFSLIVFGLLFFGLKTAAWPKISAALEQREAGIRQAIADADKARAEAQQFLKEHQAKLDAVHQEVKEILAEARRDAERTRGDILKAAEQDAEALRNRAIAEIERAKDHALHELFDRMAGDVTAAAEHLVGRSLTGEDHQRLVREALQQVGVGKA